jgi:hypothetical protein
MSQSPSNCAEDAAASVHERNDHGNDGHDVPPQKNLQLPLPALQKRTSAGSLQRLHRSLSGRVWKRGWGTIRKALSKPSTLTLPGDFLGRSSNVHELEDVSEETEDASIVDEVVVDRSWSEEFASSAVSDASSAKSLRAEPTEEGDEHVHGRTRHFWSACIPVFILKWGLWSRAKGFFNPHFGEPTETHYRAEVWAESKRLALWASVFFISNWILGASFIATPLVLADKVRIPFCNTPQV